MYSSVSPHTSKKFTPRHTPAEHDRRYHLGDRRAVAVDQLEGN
jgi:hypothetical protein